MLLLQLAYVPIKVITRQEHFVHCYGEMIHPVLHLGYYRSQVKDSATNGLLMSSPKLIKVHS